MTVKELIEKLKQEDPEAVVLVEGDLGGYFDAEYAYMENVKVDTSYSLENKYYIAGKAIVF